MLNEPFKSFDMSNRFRIFVQQILNFIPHIKMNNNFIVFSGTATRYLTEKICASLGTQMGNINVTKFSDGEFSVCYE